MNTNEDMRVHGTPATFYPLFEAFFKGNSDPTTYEQYERYRPLAIEPNNEQTRMLLRIQALTFGLIDMGMLLDGDPNLSGAVEIYDRYLKELIPLKTAYEQKYGAFTYGSESITTPTTWTWVKGPWPWEN